MHDLLHRLYKTRLTLLAVLLIVMGGAVLQLAHWAAPLPHWSWLHDLPAGDIGIALFTTGLVTIAWQYFSGEVADEHTMQLFRQVLTEQAPAMRDAVINGFAFEASDLARVASSKTLDQITTNCLALRLGDRDLASGIYADLRRQVIRSPERRRDVIVSVDLAPWEHGPAAGDGAMFVATVRWEYRTTQISPVMRFTCVSDQDEYRELLQDPTSTLTWYFRPVGALTAATNEAFQLLRFTVDGKPQTIRRSTRAKSQTFTVAIGQTSSEDAAPASSSPRAEVTVSYAYRVLVQRQGYLWLSLGQPTKGLKIALRHGGCGIRYASLLDFIAGAEQTRISQTTNPAPTPVIEAGFDGWVWPKSGVAFVWMLEEETELRSGGAAEAGM